jgi:hypothetical protein
VARARSGEHRRRGSRRSGVATPVAAPRESFVSQKRLIQAGSLAAALGSILGLAFTVGDRVTGLFGSDDSTPRVHIEKVALETMSLRTFLITKRAHVPGTPFGYSKKELDSDVLVVDIRAQYAHSSRGVSFPVSLTLEARRRGRVSAVDAFSTNYVLDDRNDSCGCHEYFRIPSRGREYRVEMQILRPNAPTSEPLDESESNWYRV